jgi:hypothetical protein
VDALRQLAVIFDVDTGKAADAVRGLGAAVDGAKSKLGNLVEGFVGSALVGGLKSFVEGQIAAAKEVRVTAAKIGVGVEQLEQFQFAAGSAGVSAEGAATGLKFLNKNLGLAITGNEEASKTFHDLGIDLAGVKDGTVNAADLLPKLAEKFAGTTSQAERTALAMKLFGRQGADLLPLLDDGPAGLEKLRQRFEELGGGMDANFIAKAKAAGRELGGMRFGIEALKRQIAVQFFPVAEAFGLKMQGVIKFVQGFAKETGLAKEAAIVFGVAAGAGALKAAAGFAKFFGILPKGAGFNLKTLLGLGEFGLIIASVLALALVLEDLWVGMHGGESAIKDLIATSLGIEDADKLFAQLSATADTISVSFQGLKPAIGNVVALLGQMVMSPYFVASVEYVVRLLGSFVALTIAAIRSVGNLALFAANVVAGKTTDADKNLDAIGTAIDQGGDAVFGKNGFFGDNATRPTPPANEAFAGPGYLNPASPDYQGPPNVTNAVTIGEITVVGGPTNEDTGKAVAGAVRSTFEDEKRNAQGAIKRGK